MPDDLPLPGVPENDPESRLSREARFRIQDAFLEAEIIRKNALAKANARWVSEGGGVSFNDYCTRGEGLPELRAARLAQALIVLRTELEEYKSAGFSRREIIEILTDRVDGMIFGSWREDSMGVIERDLLLSELRFYSTSTWQVRQNLNEEMAPAVPDATACRKRGPAADIERIREIQTAAARYPDWNGEQNEEFLRALDQGEVSAPRGSDSWVKWSRETEPKAIINLINYHLRKKVS